MKKNNMRNRLLVLMVAAAMVTVMPLSVFADANYGAKSSVKASKFAEQGSADELGKVDGNLNSTVVDNWSTSNYVRLYGATRYETAATVAGFTIGKYGFDYDSVIVASGQNYPDALGAGALAWEAFGPIMLTGPGYDYDLANTIAKLVLPDNIANCTYVMGGTGAVSNYFIDSYKKLKQPQQQVQRVYGADRYATNLATLKKLRELEGSSSNWDKKVLVCSGKSFADSLSASATGWPILLVGDSLTSAQKDYLKTQGADDIVIIGGTGAVSSTIEVQIKGLGTGANVDRVYGANRYATSYAIAKSFFDDSNEIVLAYAQNFPDGLSGCTMAFAADAPLLLCDSNNMTYVKKFVDEKRIGGAYVLGGPSLISDAAVKNLHMEAYVKH